MATIYLVFAIIFCILLLFYFKIRLRTVLITVITGVLLVAAIFGGYVFVQVNKPYTDILKHNWSIELPKPARSVYSADSGASFQGDGERYHILQYGSDENIKLTWVEAKNEIIEAEVTKVMDGLKIPKENLPDFNLRYKYYTKEKNIHDRLYLIYFTESNKLYVVENIF